MKVLSIIETKNYSHGGPPEVLNNQINVINKKKKIISVLSLEKISIFYFVKCFFLNLKDTKSMIF